MLLRDYLSAPFCFARSSTAITMFSIYEVNRTAIVLLSRMVENSNGQDVSQARAELINLVEEQIELVQVKYDETSTLAQQYTDKRLEAKAEFERTLDPWDFQDYTRAAREAEEATEESYCYREQLTYLQQLRSKQLHYVVLADMKS